MNYAVAVLDIGKTNKKIRVYDDRLRPIATRKRHIDTIRYEELDVEDVEAIEEWFLETLSELAGEYPIRALSITTHGASVVCVGEHGRPSVPPVAYTNEPEASLHDEFYAAVGKSLPELQQETVTAEVKPLINVGKLLFFLQRRFPGEFPATSHILMYPQYFAFRLTGIPAVDLTYAGCHSFLWNPHRNDWSVTVDRLGIRNLLPGKPIAPTQILGTITPAVAARTGLDPNTVVTAGIHDSNSSLVPYLVTKDEDFVLNSTGTWCVAMHPTSDFSFQPEELGKTVFYNMDYRGRPVKTSIVMAGLEYETYVELLKERAKTGEVITPERNGGKPATSLVDPGFNPELYGRIAQEARAFILPAVLRGTGQFPESEARVVEPGAALTAKGAPAAGGAASQVGAPPSPVRITTLARILAGAPLPEPLRNWEEALALVNISVAIQSAVALKRVNLKPGTTIYTEGGFRNNEAYLALLSALLPENPVALTSVEEATSFGAALIGKAALEGCRVEELRDLVVLDVQPLPARTVPGLQEYAERFVALVEE